MGNVKVGLGLLVFLFVLSAMPVQGQQDYNPSIQDVDGFVSVNGTRFYLDGKPFYFSGTNNYYLFYKPWDQVEEVLDDAKAMNLRVLRTWGFCDGMQEECSFQPEPGVYNESGFQGMDRVIKEAGDRGIKLMIPLVNNWGDFGGMCQYARWCNESIPDYNSCSPDAGSGTAGSGSHDAFYTNNCTRGLYKNYIAYFLNRTNSITGVKYKDDPAIFAWQLANEPRARSDPSGNTLYNWISEMSAFVKSIDSNHLLTTGEDGFYLNKSNEYGYAGYDGQDFISHHLIPSIDFASMHMYPWNSYYTYENMLKWIEEHAVDANTIIKKPVVLNEFGVKGSLRDEWMMGFYKKIEDVNLNGDLFWILCHDSYPDYDGYCVYYPGDSSVPIITSHSDIMNSKNDTNSYSVSQIISGNKIEHRFYFNEHHFLTIVDDSGTFNIRPHPGVDINGWGSSWYMQPFLPGAVLKHTSIESIVPGIDGIDVKASGHVSRDNDDTYGTWDINMSFVYDSDGKMVQGNGGYAIVLDEILSAETGDLNLFKIASNYLDDVPLLGGGTGDTGDMNHADVAGDSSSFVWNPPEQPGHFPYDLTDSISVDVSGRFNNVDTCAQGHSGIKAAYKPSLKVALASQQAGIPMIFGGMYDTGKAQDFWEDNVGITPLVLKQSGFIQYDFELVFGSEALPGDGTLLDGDVNGDCTVNIFDLAAVGLAYGSQPGSGGWNGKMDFSGDCAINIFDLAAVGLNYGNSC